MFMFYKMLQKWRFPQEGQTEEAATDAKGRVEKKVLSFPTLKIKIRTDKLKYLIHYKVEPA